MNNLKSYAMCIFRVTKCLMKFIKKRQCFEIRTRNFVRSFRDATEPANATNRISMPTGLRNLYE